MKEKALKIVVFGLGFICLAVFILIRTGDWAKFILSDKYDKYSDLYNLSHIQSFREELPAIIDSRIEDGQYGGFRTKPNHSKINDADILTFGDSYFFFPYHTTFSERLSNDLNKKVFVEFERNPFKTLKEQSYKKGKQKFLIYELGERQIASLFMNKVNIDPEIKISKEKKPFFKTLNTQFAEIRYNKILQQNILTGDLYTKIATLKFKMFGSISEYTPFYDEKSKFMFYSETVNDKRTSYFYDFKKDEITRIANNIVYLDNQLKELYNLQLVLMPIPSKITIYDYKVDLYQYNNLLPQIYSELKNRGILYVDLYNPYKMSDEILYYATDTHWNEKGIDLALKATINTISKTDHKNIK
jgi:hypothetical protein